jgi:hypothetical protein
MRWFMFTALGLAALACASGSLTPQRAKGSSCVGARVHYEQAPRPRLSIRLPWIAAGLPKRAIIGHLFYYDEELRKAGTLTIPTGGESPGGGSTKILWVVRPVFASVIEITGRQLDGAGTFAQTFRSASSSSGVVFPSIVNVPTAGCWQLSVRNGPVTRRFTVAAISPPTPSPPTTSSP